MAQGTVKSPSTSAQARLPKNYRLVNDILSEQGQGAHLSMAQIHALAVERMPGIGFTTVYRALDRLCLLGLVCRVTIPGADAAHYETSAPPHAHFRCTECGSISDVNYKLPQRAVNEIARRQGALVRGVALTLTGCCAACTARGEINTGQNDDRR